jgi:hypothetical protein
MLLALVSLAAAMELRVYIKSPDGAEGTVTAQVSGETVLTRFPMPIGKKYTALVSATSTDTVCTVDVEVYKGDLRRNRKILSPRLILTEFETSYVEQTESDDASGKKAKPDWQVEASMKESFSIADETAAPPVAPPAPATEPAAAPTP